MTVRELVETLRNHGFVTDLPTEPNGRVEEALALLAGAYEVQPDTVIYQGPPAQEAPQEPEATPEAEPDAGS